MTIWFARPQLPSAIIPHGVTVYLRVNLGLRDVDGLRAAARENETTRLRLRAIELRAALA
jgi:hypothetical protein